MVGAAPFDWNIIVAVGTVAGVTLAGGAGLRTVWSERRAKRDDDDDRLERIERLLSGDKDSLHPDGLVREFREFRDDMRRELTTNSGSSLKDQLRSVSRELVSLRESVTSLETEVRR